MSGAYRDVARGEPFRPMAEQVNGWNRAGNFVDNQLASLGAERGLEDGRRPEVVRIKNLTGAPLGPAAVLALGDPATGPDLNEAVFQQQINFKGTTPASAADLFAITIDPMSKNGVGLALVVGAAFVEINVADADHKYATPYPGQNEYMLSAAAGPARILWREPGTGIKRSYVLIGGGQRASEWNWVGPKTSSYTAKIGEAVEIDGSGGAVTITLPDWATSPQDGRILLANLAISAATFNSVVAAGTDKINGIASIARIMADSGIDLVTGVNAGGDWLFTRAKNASTGWSCSRFLSLAV